MLGKGYFVKAYRSAEIIISAIAATPTLQQEQRETQLLTNFPNPFNPETWIPFELEKDGRNEQGDKVASGIYFYTLQTKNISQTKKMVLLK